MRHLYSQLMQQLKVFYTNRNNIKGVNSLINNYCLASAIRTVFYHEKPDSDFMKQINKINSYYINLHLLKNKKQYEVLNQLFILCEEKIYFINETMQMMEKKAKNLSELGCFIPGQWKPGTFAVEVYK